MSLKTNNTGTVVSSIQNVTDFKIIDIRKIKVRLTAGQRGSGSGSGGTGVYGGFGIVVDKTNFIGIAGCQQNGGVINTRALKSVAGTRTIYSDSGWEEFNDYSDKYRVYTLEYLHLSRELKITDPNG